MRLKARRTENPAAREPANSGDRRKRQEWRGLEALMWAVGLRKWAVWLSDAAVAFAGYLPAIVLGMAALLVWTSIARPVPATAAAGPLRGLPPEHVVGLLSAVGLAAIALGLLRGKQFAWWLAVLTFAATLFGQSHVLSGPVRLVVAGGALAILVADRRRYRVRTGVAWQRRAVALAIVAGVAIVAETALIVVSTGAWPRPLTWLGDALAALGDTLGIDDSTANALFGIAGTGSLFAALLVLARLPLTLAAAGVLSPVPEPEPDPHVWERARGIAVRYGRGALLPFQLGEDKLVFAPERVDGVVVYGLAGRSAVMLGDPIAAGGAADATFGAFVERCHLLDRIPAVYQATHAARELLLRRGFRVFRIGSEAIIDLETFDLRGGGRANLRHTVTRAKRGGVHVLWFPDGIDGEAHASQLLPAPDGVPPALDRESLLRELVRADAAWRRKAGPAMGFTVGAFDPSAIRGQPAAVAFERDGRVAAYVTFLETGHDGGWVLDLMRRIPAGTPGSLEACLADAALELRAAGASTLSLALAPLAGLSTSDGPVAERLLALCGRGVRRWYNVDGLAFFKNKFDPRWEPRYAAVRGVPDTLRLAGALLSLHLRRSRLRPAIRPTLVARQLGMYLETRP